jgi:F0F1-type ATP synthase membrane subunit c/vacuolar-type H+-ATPase subunit K
MRKLLSSLGRSIGSRAKCARVVCADMLRCATFCVVVVCSAVVCGVTAPSDAAALLIADRVGNGVFRYSDTGQLLGVVAREVIVPGVPPTYLYQPTGIAMSPDYAKFYVSSSQLNQVVAYDYDRLTGTATNPTIFANADDGLSFPNDIQFSPDGSKIYVANLNGGVSRFHLDGSSAGEKLLLPTVEGEGVTQASSMTFMPDGRLLAGAFSDPSGAGGGVAISNADISALSEYFVEPLPALYGATGLMAHDGYLYVSGLFTGSVRRFSLADGEYDSAWVATGLEVSFPQDLLVAPDGNGFLLGILGTFPGAGRINRYSFEDGALLGTLATPSQNGFREATAMAVVPTMLVGDFNGDGTVDAVDYTVWRDNLGSATVFPNDDSPGMVDASDYDDWRANFGKPLPMGSAAIGAAAIGAATIGAATMGSAAIPEPTSFVMMLIAVLAGSMIRKRT